MSDHPGTSPEFDDLVGGDDLDPQEEERLRRMHDLLVAAGPPPDLSPLLREAPAPSNVTVLPARRRRTILVAAAALAIALFGAGYLVGARGDDAAFTVPMEGSHGERAELAVFDKDAAGNWPMELKVSAVTLREGELYELWLTRKGKLVEQCGAFLAVPGRTTVPLNAPFKLKQFDGWVVVPKGSQKAILWTPRNEA
jgi:hypothetical protein